MTLKTLRSLRAWVAILPPVFGDDMFDVKTNKELFINLLTALDEEIAGMEKPEECSECGLFNHTAQNHSEDVCLSCSFEKKEPPYASHAKVCPFYTEEV